MAQTINLADFPNLTPAQVTALRALGPLPAYVYRSAPDTSLYPMRTRSGNWEGFLRQSPDYDALPPLSEDGTRQLMYVGDADTASSYAEALMRSAPNPAGEGYVPADALSIEEMHRLMGDGESLQEFARSNSRMYRISMADILSRFTPDTRLLRDTGQQGVSWAIVGALSDDVPATHIQQIGKGEDGRRIFRDTSTGRSMPVDYLDGVTALEPEIPGRAVPFLAARDPVLYAPEQPARASWLTEFLKPTAPDAIVGRGGSAGLGIFMLAQQYQHGEADRAMGGVQAMTSKGSFLAASGAIIGDAAAVVTAGAERLASVAPRLTLTPGTARVLGVAEGIGTKAMVPLAIAAGGLESATALKGQDGHRAATAIGATAGGLLAGMAAGAATGAIVGTFIPIPIVGTAAGFVVGAAVGLGGAWLGGKIADKAAGTAMQGMVDDMARDELDVEDRLHYHERNQGAHTSKALAELEDMAKKAQDQLRRDYTRAIPLSDARALRNRDESIARATDIIERVNEETGRHFEAPERPRQLPTIDDRVKVDPKKALAEKVAAAIPGDGNLRTDDRRLATIDRLKHRLETVYHGENNVLEGQIRDAALDYVKHGGTLAAAQDAAAGREPVGDKSKINKNFKGLLGGWHYDQELRQQLNGLEAAGGWAKLIGNKDEQITLGELKKLFKEKGITISEVDQNGNGDITGGEIVRALQAHGVGAKPKTSRS